MGILDSFFGGGSDTTTVTNDPWATMPQWMQDAYREDNEFRQGLLGSSKEVAEGMMDGREILGPSSGEKLGLEEVIKARENAGPLMDLAEGNLGGRKRQKGLGQKLNSGIDFDSGIDFEDQYLNDVVDTTLSGMDRQAQRERLAREGRAAATGGTSNTRAAVGQAVADQLTGMNMAEMEAKMRSDATKWGQKNEQAAHEYATKMQSDEHEWKQDSLQEAFEFAKKYGLDEAEMASNLANTRLSQGAMVGSALSGYGELERGLKQQQMDEKYNAPKDALSWLGSMFSGTATDKGPSGSQQTTETPAPSTFSQILGAGATFAGAYMGSDERFKKEIRPMEGALDMLRDANASTYRYRDGEGHRRDRHAGLIAQSIESIPGAVVERPDGMKMVDPYPVLATVVQAVKELDKRTGNQQQGVTN